MDSGSKQGSRSDEASSAKLWAVYISEAEKYDKALVASWRNDMDGLLIFAGLFSASLTAFLVESYRTLIPESGNMTVFLLAQISQQISVGSNGTTFIASPPAVFVPTTSALICNTLWFISLGLSLSCALVATLLEQWARNFLHRADICSSPVIRARMFSFLYHALKRFNMHMVVEVVPLLLHAALLFFFGGLVAFLSPVNHVIMILSAALLGIIITGYFIITVLPLWYLDCPYHTPLSGALWRLFASLREHLDLSRCHSIGDSTVASSFHTMGEAISRRAVEASDERAVRDRRALVWTLKSLADENELEPLVDSIPDLLWGPDGRRSLHDDSILELVCNPEVQLSARIEDLLLSCDSGLLSYEAMVRRQIMCLKALWCIASLTELAPRGALGNDLFDLSLTGPVPFSDNAAVNHYAVSTRALTRWSIFRSICIQVVGTLRYIKLRQDTVASEQMPALRPALSCIDRLQVRESFFVPYWQIEGLDDAKQNIPVGSPATSLWLERLFYCLQSFRHDIPYLIFIDYLEQATGLNGLPYAYEHTRDIIRLPDRPPSSLVRSRLGWIFNDIVKRHLHLLRENPDIHWIDEILGVLASLWLGTADVIPTVSVPHALLQYLTRRNSDAAVTNTVLKIGGDILWSCISGSLTDNAWATWVVLSDSLMAVWHLSAVTLRSSDSERSSENIIPRPQVLELALSSTATIKAPAASVIAVLKATFLNSLTPSKNNRLQLEAADVYQSLTHKVFPQNTANPIPTGNELGLRSHEWYTLREVVENRCREAYIDVLAEFLESCTSVQLPYNAVETIALLDPSWLTGLRRLHIHPSVQLRFASAVGGVFQLLRENTEVLETVSTLRVFHIIIGADYTGNRWLDDPTACELIRNCFTDSLSTLSANSHPPELPARLQRIAAKIMTKGE